MEHLPDHSETGRRPLLSYSTTHPEPGVAVVTISGEMDLATAPSMADELDAVRRTAPERLVVDMSAVAFLSSTGISALLKLHNRCRETTTELVVIPSRFVLRVLTVTGLVELLGVGQPLPGETGRRQLA